MRLIFVVCAELGSNPLVFVLKLDEAKMVHGKKFEHVSMTLMNRVVDPSMTTDSEKYFSVQSEQEIWPIACFQVLKETHEILKWMFEHTDFLAIIQSQGDGKELEVPDVDSFKVEWHLTADMKTIKCMYGLSHGSNAKHSCIYCLQERHRPQLVSDAQARKVAKARAHTWEGSLFSKSCAEEPIRDGTSDRWLPILAILLHRVHICTLHVLVRVTEKILHLHFMFI